jgi:hypothetical protein
MSNVHIGGLVGPGIDLADPLTPIKLTYIDAFYDSVNTSQTCPHVVPNARAIDSSM